MKIGVIGSGSWGTALAILLAANGHNVHLWTRSLKNAKILEKEKENKKYLKGFLFPDNIKVHFDLEKCITKCSTVVMVIPSHGYREVFLQSLPFFSTDVNIVSAVKGIENNTLKTMTQVMSEVITTEKIEKKSLNIGVLSGPSFAEEVANNIPTAVTIGFKERDKAKEIQQIFASNTFRVYTSTDVLGLEISAALKNIIAIATGVCDGLGYGLNTRAALITRGLTEIMRFGIALGAKKETFSGLSGLGDLILTCTGDLSRNRTVGIKLGEGKTLIQVKNEMRMVAEGIKTTQSVYDLSRKLNVEMPILEQVYNILYKEKDCAKAVKDLLKRQMREE
jgi:glycerol-3-phosphate dehydrogenase (NAD(P)+)